MVKQSSKVSLILSLLLFSLFTQCSGPKGKDIYNQTENKDEETPPTIAPIKTPPTITPITDDMIRRARKGNLKDGVLLNWDFSVKIVNWFNKLVNQVKPNGKVYLDWGFFATKLKSLKNGENGVDVNQENIKNHNLTAIEYATYLGGDAQIVKALLDRGAKLVVSPYGDTVLHIALYQKPISIEIFKLLVSKAPKEIINKQDKTNNQTPLHIAAWYNYVEAVRALLAAGADKNAKGSNDATPLHIAAWYGYAETVKLLLEAGADKNAKGGNDDTPLHIAAWYGNAETVKLLVEAGADKDAKDSHGFTPLQLALKAQSQNPSGTHGAVIKLLDNLK